MKRLIFCLLIPTVSWVQAQQPVVIDPETYSMVASGLQINEEPQINGWLDQFDPYSENYESVPWYRKGIPDFEAWDHPNLREADVSWMSRYERIIDTRQKMNVLLRYPKLSVFDLMLKIALMPDGPTIYSDRDFKEALTDARLKELLSIPELVDTVDQYGNYGQMVVENPYPIENLNKLRVMEDWVFDKKHSRMYPRIVAVAVMYKPIIAGGSVELPEQPLLWIKYEDLRPYFINAEVFNRNMAARISMDHYFQARMFDSYIVKEPNVMDYDIRHYPEYEDDGLAALLKADAVQNELFITEHDLWEY